MFDGNISCFMSLFCDVIVMFDTFSLKISSMKLRILNLKLIHSSFSVESIARKSEDNRVNGAKFQSLTALSRERKVVSQLPHKVAWPPVFFYLVHLIWSHITCSLNPLKRKKNYIISRAFLIRTKLLYRGV